MNTEEWKAHIPVLAFQGEDISTLSITELKERISLLEAEIDRCRSVIADKQGALSDAEAFFRK